MRAGNLVRNYRLSAFIQVHFVKRAILEPYQPTKGKLMRSIQPNQVGVPLGEFDVMKSMPYSYIVDEVTGDVQDQDFWKGDPLRLIGFQRDADIQKVEIFTHDWATMEPDTVVGMYAVYLDNDGIYTDTRIIKSTSELN